MPKLFQKTKDCGCLVDAIVCSVKATDKGKMYVLGAHQHFTICNKCEKDEANENRYIARYVGK